MLPLIVSIISIFVVVGVSTTVYVQAAKQRDLYNKRLAEVIGKTNSANQYEFEKNKDQEVSLERVRGDVVRFDGQISGLQKKYESVQSEYGGRIHDLATNVSSMNQHVSKTLGKVNELTESQTEKIANLGSQVRDNSSLINKLGERVAVVDGKLVNISQQNSLVQSLITEAETIKYEQGELRDFISQVQSDSASDIADQNASIANLQTTTTNRLDVQDSNITKAYNIAKSVQNLVTTLDTAIENVRLKFGDYFTKTDVNAKFASKQDLSDVNKTFGSYLSTADFDVFKSGLPDFPTRGEMEVMLSSFLTQKDLLQLSATLNEAQLSINDINQAINYIKSQYVTNDQIMKVTGELSSGTVNISALSLTLDGLQKNLQTLSLSVTDVTNSLTSYKTDVSNTYATKVDLQSKFDSLNAIIQSLQQQTTRVFDSLTVNSTFTASGTAIINDIALSKNYSGYPDNASYKNRAEIANDTNVYKRLMLVGNKSGTTGDREVGVMDNLTVEKSATVKGKISGLDVEASGQMMIGANGSKGYFKSDGSGFVSGNFGVGVAPTDAAFTSGTKQFIARGGTASDWQAQFINPNGNRSIYMNHGIGNGVQINTNNSEATKYALQATNSTTGNNIFEVANDGVVKVFNAIENKKPDPGPILQTNYNPGGTGNRYGIGQWTDGTVRTYAGNDHAPSTVNMSFAKADGTFMDTLTAEKTGNVKVAGSIETTKFDPGPMLQRNYNPGGTGNRYGIGQWTGGIVRTYAANDHGPSTVNMSFAKADGTFMDTLTAEKTGDVKVAGKLRANVADTAVYPPGWGGGVMSLDIYSTGAIGAGDTAGNAKVSMNKNGDIRSSGTLSMVDASGNVKASINNAGVITGNGSGITNLNPANLSSAIGADKGGTGFSTPTIGKLLVGNGTSWIQPTELHWDNTNKRLGVGAGKTAPAETLDVAGTVSATTLKGGLDVGNISGTLPVQKGGTGSSGLTANKLIFGNAAATSYEQSTFLHWDNTNSRLGIGTTNPQAKLHVQDGITVRDGANNVKFEISPTQNISTFTGDLNINGKTSSGNIVTSGTICINSVCLNETDLQNLKNAASQSQTLYAFTSHTFTNAGATGRLGPDLAQCRSAYSAASWAQNSAYFNMTTQGIQLWTVPLTGAYRFELAGAMSGNVANTPTPGYGRKISGVYNLTSGNVVSIIVGQMGTAGYNWNSMTCNAGGGGGSFVFVNNTLLFAAGGGGGPNGWRNGNGGNANFGNSGGGAGGSNGGPGTGGGAGSYVGAGAGQAGSNGSGGNGGTGDGGGGGGGGTGNTTATYVGGAAQTPYGGAGGFGGGGSSAGGGSVSAGGGGGGGYSGGGGGSGGSTSNDGGGGGGGGGSYGGSADLGTNAGHGYVTITKA